MNSTLSEILDLHFTPLVLAHLISFLVGAMLLHATKKRLPAGQTVHLFRLGTFGLMIWSWFEATQVMSHSRFAQEIWLAFQSLGFATAGTVWLVFADRLSTGKLTQNKKAVFFLTGIYLATVAVVATNPWHHLFWTSKDPLGLQATSGPLLWVVLTVHAGLLSIGLTELTRHAARSSRLRKAYEPVLIVVSAGFPIFYIILAQASVIPDVLTGPATTVFAVGMYVVLRNHQPTLKTPLSLPVVLESIDSALCGLTPDGLVAESNAKLGDLFGGLLANCTLDSAADLVNKLELDRHKEITKLLSALPQKRVTEPIQQICRVGAVPRAWASVGLHPLRIGATAYGYILQIRDVSEQTQLAEDLKRREAELQAAHLQLAEAHSQLAARADELQQAVEEKARQLEEQHQQLLHAQKMESLGTLAGGIAHDFNNVLFSLIGYADLIAESAQDPKEVVYCAQKIKEGAQRAAELTRKLLGFARRDKPRLQEVDLADMVKDVVGILRRTIEPRIQFRYDIQTQASHIVADPQQMHQVLMNLCLNASEAIQGVGQVSITVTSSSPTDTTTPPETERVVLTISDTGSGMNEEVLSRIFEPFFTTKSRGKGTGLGLSLVYGIVKEHGGEISVESQPGKGSTFTITLPRARTSDPASKPHPNVSEILAQARRPRKTFERISISTSRVGILVVDDNPEVLALSQRYFDEPLFQIWTAATAAEALSLVRKHSASIEVVLMDLILPDADPEVLLSRILAIQPDLAVVVMSGYHDDDRITRLMSSGAAKFLRKPFSRRDLRAVVRHLLEK